MNAAHGRLVLLVTAIVLAVGGPAGRAGAGYPDRPIDIIVAWPPGGGADNVTRTLAKFAEKELGQQINVVNLPGGNGAIGYRRAATARPDGYTLMNLQSSLVDLEIQGLADVSRATFIPIVAVASQSVPLITRSDSPFKTFEDFLAQVRAHPGKVNVAGSPLRSNFHQAAVLLMERARIKFNYVPTAGSPKTLATVAGGHVDTGLFWFTNADPYIRSGEMRTLVVFTEKRLAQYPDVPSIKEKGLGGLANVGKGYYGVGVPRGTPPEIVRILEEAFRRAYDNPETQRELRDQRKVELMYLGSAEFKTFLDEMYVNTQEALKLIDERR